MTGFRIQSATILLAFSWACDGVAQTFARNESLPDAPSATLQAPNQIPEVLGTARVQGIVLDLDGNTVPGATVILAAPGKIGERSVVAGSDASFVFTDVPAGEFRLIITAPGLDPFDSIPFAVKAGTTVEAPKIALKLATSSTVNVFATPDQVAEAEVQAQEKQRVLGVFPNFYTSYIWDAQPMSAKQKYKLAFRSLVDPVHFLIVAGVAGAEQYNGNYAGYGPGIEGYGKRYGAALANSTTSRIVGSAILPAVFHQDPRYFYQGSGGFRSRTWHALKSVVVCRGDNGKQQPNFSHILGSLIAGAVANTYHPDASRGLGLTFETLGVTVAGNAASNLFREFVLRGLVPSVPDFANGKK